MLNNNNDNGEQTTDRHAQTHTVKNRTLREKKGEEEKKRKIKTVRRIVSFKKEVGI